MSDADEIKKKARDILEHGDPLAYMIDTAKRLDYRIDEKVFEAMLLLTVTEHCVAGGCSQEGKDTLKRMREDHELERAVLDHLTGAV